MNVLLTSVGRRNYLVRYFREALEGRGKVVATNSFLETSGMMEADISHVVPSAADPKFLDALLAVCREQEIRLLFSLHDWESPFIAAEATRFEKAGVRLGVSPPEVLETGLDKFATWKFCMRNRLNAPVTFLIEDDALRALDAGKVRFPLVVKPRRGQGSLGLHVVYEKAELSAALLLARAQVARFKDNGLSVKDGGLSVIIQEFLIGEEFGLDVVNDLEGQFRACLVKRKLGMRAGETDAAESVRDAALEKFGAAIGCALGHLGMLDVDVIVRNGQPYLLEFNPRFGGHYPFSHMAGANVPAALLAWARGEEPKPEWLQVGKGIISLKEYSMRVQMQTYA